MANQDLTLGRLLENERQRAGLTLRQLAEAADIQLTIIARLLRDGVISPKPDHLMRLASVLELRASDLFLLAGVVVPRDLPSVEALLRTEYELPDEAVAEAKRQIDAIVARYQSTSTPRKEDPHGNN